MGDSYVESQVKYKQALPDQEYEELAESLLAKTKGKGKKRRKYDEKRYALLFVDDLERVMSREELRDLSLRIQELSAKNETTWLDELFDEGCPQRTKERREYVAKLLRQAAR